MLICSQGGDCIADVVKVERIGMNICGISKGNVQTILGSYSSEDFAIIMFNLLLDWFEKDASYLWKMFTETEMETQYGPESERVFPHFHDGETKLECPYCRSITRIKRNEVNVMRANNLDGTDTFAAFRDCSNCGRRLTIVRETVKRRGNY